MDVHSVVVVTDSSASLPGALAAEWGIAVVPLAVAIDGQPRADGHDVESEDIVDALVQGQQVTTSQPSVGAFIEAYERARDSGASAVVSVHLSSDVSGTVDSARAAASAVDFDVTVVDTRQFTLAIGFAAIEGARTARAGAAADVVAARVREVAASCHTYFTVDSLEYLKRGGRISPTVAAIGAALKVRPVMEVKDGALHVLHRVRTTARARASVTHHAAEWIRAAGEPLVGVLSLADDGYGGIVAAQLRAEGASDVTEAPLSAGLAAHTGPGVLAVVVADLASQRVSTDPEPGRRLSE